MTIPKKFKKVLTTLVYPMYIRRLRINRSRKFHFVFSRVSIVAHGNLAVIFAREQLMNTASSTRFHSISTKPWFFPEPFLMKNTAHPS